MAIEKIGVIGAGQMGNGIAHVAAQVVLSACFRKSALLASFVVSLSNHPRAEGPFDKLRANGRF